MEKFILPQVANTDGSDCDRLFHQVDRSYPYQEYFSKVIISFLEDIIARFGYPSRIVTDNDASFKSDPLVKFCEQFEISLIHSTPYYPQENGLAEFSNKSLSNSLKGYWKTIRGPGIQSSSSLYGPIE